jgi:hypothetical protein
MNGISLMSFISNLPGFTVRSEQSNGVSVIGACVTAFPPQNRADLARACGAENLTSLDFVDRKMKNIGDAKNWLRHEHSKS